jgi:hypothetical protein
MRQALIAATLLFASLACPAPAQQAGTYRSQGTGADGSAYQGTATLRPIGGGTWQVEWLVEGAVARGLGFVIPEGPLLVVGYTMEGETGVIAYAIGADGTLRGRWTQGAGGFIAAETLTPAGTLPGK